MMSLRKWISKKLLLPTGSPIADASGPRGILDRDDFGAIGPSHRDRFRGYGARSQIAYAIRATAITPENRQQYYFVPLQSIFQPTGSRFAS
jgi:hypothetical protein